MNKNALFDGVFDEIGRDGFYTQLLFLINRTLPIYLTYVKKNGELPSFFPSPLDGAEERIKFLFEEIWSDTYVKQIDVGKWILTPKGESVLRGMESDASDIDRWQLRRAISG